MATVNLTTNDGEKQFKATGVGSVGDPFIPVHSIEGSVEVGGSVEVTSIPSIQLDAGGVVGATDSGPTAAKTQYHLSTADATTAIELVAAPGSGNRIVVWDLFISVGTNMKVTIQDGDPSVYVAGFFTANNGIEPFIPRSTLLIDEDKNLEILAGAAGNIEVTVFYSVETV